MLCGAQLDSALALQCIYGLFYSTSLRGYDHCLQVAFATNELIAFNRSDVGGDDHVGASAALGAVAIMDNWGCAGRSLCGCERAVDDGGGVRKRIRS